MEAKAEVAAEQLAGMTDANNRFRLAAHRISPSVVGIKTVQAPRRRSPGDEWTANPLFRTQGEGSGVIVDESGYLLTNYHVIDRASEIEVQLADGRTVRGGDVEVIGADPLTDLAVLKINAGDLIAAEWGMSDELEVGDDVLAVGNPFGFARTVTAGIVSATERRDVANLRFGEFLQTDAAVNPGNSGGPLVNLKGEVVGINTAIYGRSYQGISFAIPSGLAQEVYEKLKATGAVERGWLGVGMADLDEEIAARLGLEEVRGALVAGVVPDSPADRAGLRQGDVIVEWNGLEIDEPTDLSRAVARTEVGSEAEVVAVREGRRMEFTVQVGRRPPQLR
jgi:serine protease Do